MSRTYKDAPRHVKLMRDFKKNRNVEHDHHDIGREVYFRKAVFVDGQRIDEETFNISNPKGVAELEKHKSFLHSHSLQYTIRKRMWYDFSDDDFVTVRPSSYELAYEYEDRCTEDDIPAMFRSKADSDGILENEKHAPCTPKLTHLEYKKESYYHCYGYCAYWTYSGRAKNKSMTQRFLKAHHAGVTGEDLFDFNDFTDDDRPHSCYC